MNRMNEVYLALIANENLCYADIKFENDFITITLGENDQLLAGDDMVELVGKKKYFQKEYRTTIRHWHPSNLQELYDGLVEELSKKSPLWRTMSATNYDLWRHDMIGILYFSSTGNSLYIAQKVQNAMGGQIKYIPKYEGDGSEFERMILVTPIYSFGMPTFVYNLIPKLNKTTELIIIQNYGGMVSGADYFIYKYAMEQGLNMKAVYVLRMPENFTTTFTVPKFYINSTLKSADQRIDAVLDDICSGEYRVPKKRRTKEDVYLKNKANWHRIGEGFSTTNACIKCEKCISVCPVGNICLQDGKIVFSKKVYRLFGMLSSLSAKGDCL